MSVGRAREKNCPKKTASTLESACSGVMLWQVGDDGSSILHPSRAGFRANPVANSPPSEDSGMERRIRRHLFHRPHGQRVSRGLAKLAAYG